jgi:Mor family transcriptional regulator
LGMALRDIVGAIGDEAAAKLVDRFGGQQVYVPRETSGHAIADAIGQTAAQKLSAMFGGEVVYIPKGRRPSETKAAIAAASGTARDVAARIGCSVRHVQQVRSGK